MSTSISSPTPMLESDLETAARFMYASQMQQATNRFMFLDWPNESAQLALYDASMRQMFKDKTNEMYKITTDSGEMIASLVLTRKKPMKADDVVNPVGDQKPIDTSAMNPAARPAMRHAMMTVLEPMQGIDHLGNYRNAVLTHDAFEISFVNEQRLVLSTIFVKPDVRSKGLGTQLVKLSMERAAAEGVPLFLSSVPSAAEFYRKLGFKDTTHADIDLSQWGPKYGGFGVYRLQGMLSP